MPAKVITESDIRRKLQITGERMYRSGLAKADAGDLTRAAEDLEAAVRYDKYNKDARNLLGLIRFETGELGEALKQWGISAHLFPENNQATEYMEQISSEVDLLTSMSDAIVMYNEALELTMKGEFDFALIRLKRAVKESPKYIKAQLLLSLVYMETEAYKMALAVLDEVAKIDPLNPDAMKYRLYIAAQQKGGAEDLSISIRDLSNDIYVQNALPEPELKKISSRVTGRRVAGSAKGFGMQILLLAVGIVLGVELMALLYVPGKLSAAKEEARNHTLVEAQLQNEIKELKVKVSASTDFFRQIAVDNIEVTEEVREKMKAVLDSWDK